LLRGELTLAGAVQVALLNNRDLQATYADLGIAQADLLAAGLLENPVFSLTWYMGDAGSSPELSLVQDFIGILSASARRRAGEAVADRVTLDVASRVVELAAEVKSQYYTVVGDTQALELARQVVSATEAAAELAERQRAAGNLSRREQMLQQAFYAQTLLDVAQAQAQLASDREKLNRLMGVWGEDTRWRMPAQLPAAPAQLPELQDVEALAVTNRLDLAAAKKEAEAAAQAAGLTRQFSALSPLGIGVAFKREAEGDKFVGPTIELGLPIFNRAQAQMSRATTELERSVSRVAALAVEVRSQAREARARLSSAHEILLHYQRVLLPLQQTILSETQKHYNGMLVGVYDLLLAKQTQVQTARQYIAATRDFWLAWAELERVVGVRVPISAGSQSATPAEVPDPPQQPTHEHGDEQP
jgi:cobalt-zinc-cadmium efflux system outer membrane protein